ncbi:KAP family P-loop NTPase fold protein [Streptomyces sp. NRRL S-646]|uniref:KAP family P-loop NTPase fold protein n=1 Tax=Streptomyces sp. NRRL S-646 TaxID=1463917 RepID=UPI0004C93640|nr:P-loop NTPase fold protein [Streptomyces sp. NRRL S-646]
MRPLTDNPISRPEDDAFHFEPYVTVLHEAVAQAKPLPLTVGVFGSWGSGKSSFLKLWEERFAREKVRTIWFNPWKYDRKVEVWAALLHTILAELEKEERLGEKARRLARAATWLSVRAGLGAATALGTGGVIKGEAVDQMLQDIAVRDSEQYRQINRFETDFAQAVKEFVGDEGRLIVFVDDLDRCTPESAMTVLESLKLFLAETQCVFVLALDLDVLAAVATNKFGEALKGAPAEVVSGLAYLDKIVQLPFFLPDVGFDTLRAAYGTTIPDFADLDFFWGLLRHSLGNNPRRLKRYLNVLSMALAVTRAQTGSAPTRLTGLQLALLLIFRTRYRSFFHHLAAEPDSWRVLTDYFERVQGDPRNAASFRTGFSGALHHFALDAELENLLMYGGGDRVTPPDGPAVLALISTLRRTAGPDGVPD